MDLPTAEPAKNPMDLLEMPSASQAPENTSSNVEDLLNSTIPAPASNVEDLFTSTQAPVPTSSDTMAALQDLDLGGKTAEEAKTEQEALQLKIQQESAEESKAAEEPKD